MHQKFPDFKELLGQAGCWVSIYEKALEYFNGNTQKAERWFTKPSQMLGGHSPEYLLQNGGYAHLSKWLIPALESSGL